MNEFLRRQNAIDEFERLNPERDSDSLKRALALIAAPPAVTAVVSRNPGHLALAGLTGISAGVINRLLHRKKIADELGIPINLLGKPIHE